MTGTARCFTLHSKKLEVCRIYINFLGGGLGIYTDRDQWSIFWGDFEFWKSVFLLVKAAVFLGVVK